MTYTYLGGSAQKGYLFQASGIIMKGWGFHKLKVKSDHRSKFSNLSNWKEEA